MKFSRMLSPLSFFHQENGARSIDSLAYTPINSIKMCLLHLFFLDSGQPRPKQETFTFKSCC